MGVAQSCAPSRGDPASSGTFLDDAHSLALPLAGYGYGTVCYARTSPPGSARARPAGWLLSEDEAHSLLDATRAMSNLIQPGTLSGDVVLVGHSQGGHAVLSADAYAGSYGLSGNLAGVVAEAPLWIPARSWGAALTNLLVWSPTVSTSALTYALQYFYGHAEVYNGPGHGTDMLADSMKAGVAQALTTSCLDTLSTKIAAMGSHPSDFFATGFSAGVSVCADTGVCGIGAPETWRDRFQADRPPVDPSGAPIVLIHGGQDTTVTPALAECGIEKIRADLSNGATTQATFCFDPGATHGAVSDGSSNPSAAVTRRNADWINQWVLARTLGGAEPAACTPWTGKAADGTAIQCPSLPPNSDFGRQSRPERIARPVERGGEAEAFSLGPRTAYSTVEASLFTGHQGSGIRLQSGSHEPRKPVTCNLIASAKRASDAPAPRSGGGVGELPSLCSGWSSARMRAKARPTAVWTRSALPHALLGGALGLRFVVGFGGDHVGQSRRRASLVDLSLRTLGLQLVEDGRKLGDLRLIQLQLEPRETAADGVRRSFLHQTRSPPHLPRTGGRDDRGPAMGRAP